jgi:epoxyqueuosine reductase
MTLESFIKDKAKEIGFSACGIAKIEPVGEEAVFFNKWIDAGYNAGMKYLENYPDIRFNPEGLIENGRSIISVALNYYPEQPLPESSPQIAYYAYGKDYHIVLKKKLSDLWSAIKDNLDNVDSHHEARIFTDSAPILERYWAWRAGIGWIGINCNLIIPGKGSFFFLGEIVTTIQLIPDSPIKERCGKCRRCLDACPTGALEKPRLLNANNCFSYLTIENRGEIPNHLADKLGNRLFGCDTCQKVCPWNRFSKPANEEDFKPTEAFLSISNKEMTREDYSRIFSKSAVKRAKYEGIIRTFRHLKK